MSGRLGVLLLAPGEGRGEGSGRCLRLLVLGVWLLLLTGCATPLLTALRQHPPLGLPQAAQIGQVPFFPQHEYQCGPASLAMVAQFAGVTVSPDDLRPQVYLPDRQGSLQIEMLATVRRQGLMALVLPPRLDALLKQVAAGQPVVVLQNLSLPIAPLWHYAVVVAYDLPTQTLWLHSGLNERMPMDLATFERTWARGGHWALLAIQPARIPPGTEPVAWLQAAEALARVHAEAAQQAFEEATRAWPGQPLAWLGLGNSLYRQGLRQEAGHAFEAATRATPDFADAWNNLAQVRLEQGRREEAALAIAHAVRLGGPRLARYQELQRQVLSAQALK